MGACCCSSGAKTASESLHSSFPIPRVFSRKNTKRETVPENILGGKFSSVEDDYEIGKELGRGLYGITRLAKDRKTGEMCACKSISKRRLTATNFRNVRRERDILERVSGYAHVAGLLGAYEDEQFVHFVLELCAGGMLYDGIAAQRHYSERKAAALLRSMVEIVAYLHSQGVMHRDLKLENFMLKGPEEGAPLMAIDFGLSVFFQPGQRFSEIAGSAYYVAPEVLKKDYGPQCDVWSVGVILYMLLSGTPPFWDVTEAGICAAVLRGEYDMVAEPWPSISSSAKDLVRRILEMDPGKRISLQQILEHEWAREGGCASAAPIATPVYKRVRQFCRMNQMKRHALHVIADCCLDSSEVELIRARFDRLDVDQDGLITVEDLIDGLRRLSIPVPESDVRAMFDAADADCSGALDFAEYASAIMVKRLDPTRIRRAFDFFDRQGNGYITADDLRAALAQETRSEAIERIMAEVDTKQDGKIDYAEFERMMREGMEGESCVLRGALPQQLSELTASRLAALYPSLPRLSQGGWGPGGHSRASERAGAVHGE